MAVVKCFKPACASTLALQRRRSSIRAERFQIGTLACFIDVPSSHFATFEFHRSLVGPRTPGRSHVADLEGVPQVEQTAYRLIESQTFGLRRSRCAGHHFWRIIACYFHHETKPVGGLKAKVESFVAYSKYRVAKCSRLFCPDLPPQSILAHFHC